MSIHKKILFPVFLSYCKMVINYSQEKSSKGLFDTKVKSSTSLYALYVWQKEAKTEDKLYPSQFEIFFSARILKDVDE